MMYLTGFAISYIGCAVLYHSGRKRSAWLHLRESPALRGSGYVIGGCLLLLALGVFATGQGWERGIPLWLGIVTPAGLASLLLAVTRPKLHLWSVPVILGLSALILCWGVLQ